MKTTKTETTKTEVKETEVKAEILTLHELKEKEGLSDLDSSVIFVKQGVKKSALEIVENWVKVGNHLRIIKSITGKDTFKETVTRIFGKDFHDNDRAYSVRLYENQVELFKWYKESGCLLTSCKRVFESFCTGIEDKSLIVNPPVKKAGKASDKTGKSEGNDNDEGEFSFDGKLLTTDYKGLAKLISVGRGLYDQISADGVLTMEELTKISVVLRGWSDDVDEYKALLEKAEKVDKIRNGEKGKKAA